MLFASWLYKDDELRDGKKLFPFVFSFSKMMLSFSKRMVSFRKVHWVFFLSLELRSSFEKKNSMDFPSGHHPFASGQHHFASGENNCKKFFAIPQYPHPYIIFWQIKTPDFIFQLLSIISHPFGFILQQTPIQNYILHWSVKKKHSRESYITLEATHETRAKVKSGCPSNDIIKS